MLRLFAKHSLLVVCLAVMLEEAGVPLPIPTDVMIVFAGAASVRSFSHLVLLFLLLSVASVTGASVLYAIVRRGGRPLVERFGRYVHLGPAQLARGERLLERGGWSAIAVGRAIPGFRYGTVVACGLLNVPYRRFVTAHLVGSSVYIAFFLWLGYMFGPGIISRLHVPDFGLRLLWLLALAAGLPLVLLWAYTHAHPFRPTAPSPRRLWGATLGASLVGASTLAATWSLTPTLTALFGSAPPLPLYSVEMIMERGLPVATAHVLLAGVLLVAAMGVSAVYFGLVAAWIERHEPRPIRQVAELMLLGSGVLLVGIAAIDIVEVNRVLLSWRNTTALLLTTNLLGVLSYAFTTVYARGLAIALMPSWRLAGRKEAPSATSAHRPRPSTGHARTYPNPDPRESVERRA
jgi:membrane protein DedA with SNARE-associated domain